VAGLALPAILRLTQNRNAGANLRTAAGETVAAIYVGSPSLVTAREARQAEKLSALRPTQEKACAMTKDGILHLRLPLAANGVSFNVVSPE
jgi:hypothetical protein